MACEDRPGPPAVSTTDTLTEEGNRYAFFQALRLIRLRTPGNELQDGNVRVRPAVTLSFPENDIESITIDDAGTYNLIVNFFGLYGVTSPLPTFYTEDLIDEKLQGNSSMRDFLDIVHAALYPLLFRSWEKNRLWLTVAERHDERRLNQLFALVGLSGARRVADARALLPQAGNFNLFPRSALGLQALVSSMLGDLHVDVEPCVADSVSIPDHDRCLLGEQACRLGEDTLPGSIVADHAGSFIVHIGPIPRERFRPLLPGSPVHERLARGIALYIRTPLRCVLGLRISPTQRDHACLGAGWQCLGWDTWLPEGQAEHTWPRYDEVFLPIDITPTRFQEEAMQ